MDIERRNAEGYLDPTVHQALCNIQHEEKATKKATFKPLVYICSQYAGDIETNTKKAKEYCRFALRQKTLPIAMHLMLPQFMDYNDPKQRSQAMFMNSVILGKCNELWVFTDGVISAGMQDAIDTAKKRKQTIRWFNTKCEEVLENA